MEATRHYNILNEIWNAITHGIAVGLAIAGLILLLLRATDAWQTVSFALYGAMLILLFLFSTLRHSLAFTRAATLFRVFDHNGIYLLIAGTYSPYTLVTLRTYPNAWLGWTIFGLVWACAITGVTLTSIFLRGNKHSKLSTGLFVLMGWVILVAIWPLYQQLAPAGFWLLVAGGVTYSLGALFYHYKFPYAHVVWHLFVMVAAFLMWLSIYGFVGK